MLLLANFGVSPRHLNDHVAFTGMMRVGKSIG